MDMYSVLNITEEGRGGGAMGRMVIMARALRPHVKTTIVFPAYAKKYGERLMEAGIDGISMRLHSLTKAPIEATKYILCFFLEVYQLIKIIKKVRPDIVHVNGSWQIKGLIAGRITGAKVVWHMNDSFQPLFVRMLFRVLSRLPNAYVFASLRTKNYYEAINTWISKKPGAVIAAPVDTNKIREVIRTRGAELKILTVGYINPHKGLELLIEAADRLKDKKVEFHILGPVLPSQNNYKQSLDRLQKKLGVTNLQYLGFQQVDGELLESYDYYLCSSIREASPMAVWEAMASGLPIISTDVGDVQGIIHQYQCGQVCSELTGAALAKTTEAMMNQSEEEYQEMCRRARQCAVDLFSVEEATKHYLSFYSKVIRGKSH